MGQPVNRTSIFVNILLLVIWTAGAADTSYDGQKKESSRDADHHSNHQTETLHVILDHLIFFSATVSMSVRPAAKYGVGLVIRRAVKSTVPLAKKIYVPSAVFRSYDNNFLGVDGKSEIGHSHRIKTKCLKSTELLLRGGRLVKEGI